MKTPWLLGPIFVSMLALLSGGPASGQEPTRNTLHDVATGKLKAAELPVTFNLLAKAPLTKKMPFISNGTILAAQQAFEAAEGPRHEIRCFGRDSRKPFPRDRLATIISDACPTRSSTRVRRQASKSASHRVEDSLRPYQL
jgi:hypothetical protein